MPSSWPIYSCIFQSQLWFIWKRLVVPLWLRFMSINFKLLHDLVCCWSYVTSKFRQKINVKYVFTLQTHLYLLCSVSDLLHTPLGIFDHLYGSFFSYTFCILKYVPQPVCGRDLFTSNSSLWRVDFTAIDVLKTWQKGNRWMNFVN